MGAKVWYIAAGKKKAGPMTSGRLARQVSQGRVPDGALAWKEGMEEWEPVGAIERFQGDEESGDTTAEIEVAPRKKRKSSREGKSLEAKSKKDKVAVIEAPSKPARKAPSKPARKAPSKSAHKARKRKVEVDATVALSFVPLYRIERKDMWRAFGMGLEGQRIKLALAATLLPAVVVGVIAGIGFLAAKAHVLLALPFALLAGVAAYVLSTVGMGALSYYSRHQLQELERPSPDEAIRYALGRASAMSLPPFVLSIAWIVPMIALAILAVMVKIPYAGPLGTGLLFGVHVSLSASVMFLVAAAGVAGMFGPVTAAFEETGAKATMSLVLGFAKRSLVRTGLWGWLPSAALVPFAGVLIVLGLVTLALPLLALFSACGPETVQWIQSGGAADAPYPMITVMLIMIAAWIGLVFTALGAVVVSVQNALLSLLYLGGREGNDEQVSRDTYLARRVGGEV